MGSGPLWGRVHTSTLGWDHKKYRLRHTSYRNVNLPLFLYFFAGHFVGRLDHAPRTRLRAAWGWKGHKAACGCDGVPGLMRLLPQTGLRLTSHSRRDMLCAVLRVTANFGCDAHVFQYVRDSQGNLAGDEKGLAASTTNITSECRLAEPLLETCIGVSATLPGADWPSPTRITPWGVWLLVSPEST